MAGIFALDIGVSCGWAAGVPGRTPVSGTVRLKSPAQSPAHAFSTLLEFLVDQWSDERPALLVKERMLPLQAFVHLGNAEATVRMTAGLHAAAEIACVRHGVPWEDAADSTIRKHFIGKGRLGTRTETKAAVVNRCHILGYLPRDCRDADRSDALACWDFAAATYDRATRTGGAE